MCHSGAARRLTPTIRSADITSCTDHHSRGLIIEVNRHIFATAINVGEGAGKGGAVDELEVDPVDLHASSAHMEMHHAELLATHAVANESIEAAQVGWVGASGAALLAKLAEWQTATAQLASDIAAHGAAFQTAATGYATADRDGADTLDQQI